MRACRSHSEWLDLWDVHTPFASGLQSVRDLVLRKYVPGEHVTVGEYKGDSLANSNKGDRTSKHNGVLRSRPECHPGALGWQHHPRGQGKARGDAAPHRHVRD